MNINTRINTGRDGTVYQLYPAIDGNEDAPVIALVHGLGLTRATWDGYIQALAAHHRVLAYDLAGHGQSLPPSRTPDLTFYSDQLAALLDELAIEKCIVAGFSLGGMINRRFAMDYPDRTVALVILNSPHERGAAAQELVEQQARDAGKGGPGATLDAIIKRWFTPKFIAHRPDIITMVGDWVLANDAECYADCRRVLATGVIELIRPDPPITHPTIVITCEYDSGSTPAMTIAIASEIPAAKAVIVPGLQHMGLLEQPALFTSPILTFLDEIKASI